MSVRGAMYLNSNNPVQGSFGLNSSSNVSVSTTGSTPVQNENNEFVIISSTNYVRVNLAGAVADVTDMIIPPGLVGLLIDKNSGVSLLSVDGTDFEASIIFPRTK